VGQVGEKCILHCCKQHILDYNIYRNRNPSLSPSFLFRASNICNFCDHINPAGFGDLFHVGEEFAEFD